MACVWHVQVDDEGRTALHLAVQSGFVEVVRSLLREGADVNLQTRVQQYTPLMYACEKGGNDQLVEVLLKQANINSTLKNAYGNLALDILKSGGAKCKGLAKLEAHTKEALGDALPISLKLPGANLA